MKHRNLIAMGPSSRFLIHHISDLHFGKGREPVEQKMPRQLKQQTTYRTDSYLSFLKRNDIDRPDIIIVSGDISSTGSYDECSEAEKFLIDVAQYTTNGETLLQKVVVVPGNHDVTWEEISKGRDQARFQAFEAKTAKFTTPASELRSVVFRDRKVLVYPINSASLGGARLNPDDSKAIQDAVEGLKASSTDSSTFRSLETAIDRVMGLLRIDPAAVDAEEIKRMEDDLRDIHQRFPDFLKVAVVHHNATTYPVPEFKSYDLFNMGRMKQILMESGFQILLHGHKHAFQAMEERNLETGTSLSIVGAGTLSSYGSASFNEISVDTERCLLSIHEVPWRAHNFSKDGRKPITVPWPERRQKMFSLVTRLYKIDHHVSSLVENVFDRLDDLEIRKQEDVGPALEGICDVLEAWKVGVSGVDINFVKEMKGQLKSGLHTHLFFTDVLGPQAWSHPSFSVHLAHQIRHYIKFNYRGGTNGDGRWCLDFEEPLRSAILRSINNAKQTLELYKESSYRSEQFELLSDIKPDEAASRPRFEIARILIWDPQDLARPAGEALIRLHKVMKVPLFYLAPDDLGDDYGRIRDIEFHFFCKRDGENLKWTDHGYWHDKRDTTQRRKRIDVSINGIGDPLSTFLKLLAHPKLLLAHDMMREVMRADSPDIQGQLTARG